MHTHTAPLNFIALQDVLESVQSWLKMLLSGAALPYFISLIVKVEGLDHKVSAIDEVKADVKALATRQQAMAVDAAALHGEIKLGLFATAMVGVGVVVLLAKK